MSIKDNGSFENWAQKVAEAIASVLRMDITIMNEEYLRIAGTGQYLALLGRDIERKTAFDYCLRNSKPYIIERAWDHPICADCPQDSACVEEAEICVPILFQDKAVGVIGLVAFSRDQKEAFLAGKQIYLNYVQKMGDLLAAKYAEMAMANKNMLLSKRLETIIGMINESLIVYSSDGEVLYQNAALTKLLQEVAFPDRDRFPHWLWQHETVQKFCRNTTENLEIQELLIEREGQHYSFMISIKHLRESDGSYEVIVTLQNLKKLEKKIMQVSEVNRMQLSFDHIIGNSPAIEEVKRLARQAAAADSSVLILGESGTGKEIFARAIHNESKRRDRPFIPINCGAIPDELLESELFGHEKGAFTGAYRTKIGKFEVADNGTIFLDEIGDMPIHLQVKLLRVLQEKEICRVGSNTIRKVDIRIISATNQNISGRMKTGSFREDLYYRLNIIPITIPPLRERGDDIIPLARYFLAYYAERLNDEVRSISPEAEDLLRRYAWPGNVRELQNVIEYAIGTAHGKTIDRATLMLRLKTTKDRPLPAATAEGSLSEYLSQCEADYLQQATTAWRRGEKSEQAICREMKISRATLYRKLRQHGISLNFDTVS